MPVPCVKKSTHDAAFIPHPGIRGDARGPAPGATLRTNEEEP
jgi:hypothetical protein